MFCFGSATRLRAVSQQSTATLCFTRAVAATVVGGAQTRLSNSLRSPSAYRCCFLILWRDSTSCRSWLTTSRDLLPYAWSSSCQYHYQTKEAMRRFFRPRNAKHHLRLNEQRAYLSLVILSPLIVCSGRFTFKKDFIIVKYPLLYHQVPTFQLDQCHNGSL